MLKCRAVAALADVLVLAADGTSASPPSAKAYILNLNNTISVIDTATNQVISTFPVAAGPTGVAVNPDGTRIWVTGGDFRGIAAVFDAATHKLVAVVPVGKAPWGVVVNPAGTLVYVANSFNCGPACGGATHGRISVIDTVTNTVKATISLADGIYPWEMAINQAGTRLYFSINSFDHNLGVIDTANNTVVATVDLVGGAMGLALNSAGTRAYVVNPCGSGSCQSSTATISVIDTTSNRAIATVPVGYGANDVAVNPAGTFVYVTNSGTDVRASGTVSVIDTASDKVVASIPVGSNPSGIAVTADGSRVYVANNGDDTVSVIDASSNNVVTTVPVACCPTTVAIH